MHNYIKDIPYKSITLISILISFVLLILYANVIFYQFTLIQITSLAIIFLLILGSITLLFDKNYFLEGIEFNMVNLLISIILVFFLILIASTALTDAVYYRAFPLLEADMGLGAHPDSSFHISLIQSIMTFGYPSTAQHDIPIIYYHVLSHYMDALILTLTNLDPYDSYGLLYYFKVITFLSAILIFISQVVRKSNVLIYIILYLILTPMLVSTWTPIFSHALWFTSILTILSASKIYQLLVKKEIYTNRDYLFFFLIIIIISLGKISLGFMYATFIGMYLLLKHWRVYPIYILGIGWIIFFYIFQTLMGASNISAPYYNLTINMLYEFFLNISTSLYGMLQSIYTSILILSLITILFRTKENINFVLASIFSLIVLSFIIISHQNFIAADIFYFEYSLAFILILLIFQSIFKNFKTVKQTVIGLLILFGTSYFYHLPKINLFSLSISSIKQSFTILNYRPFLHFNRMLPNQENITFTKGGLSQEWVKIQKTPLHDFKIYLQQYMKENNLNKKNTFLFISREIFEKDLNFISSKKWSTGLFIYAFTGVPLIYANKTLIRGFGYSSYTKKSLWTSQYNFTQREICHTYPLSTIIIVDNFEPPQFNIFNCNTITDTLRLE